VDHVLIDERQAIERTAGGDAASFGTLVELYQEVAFRAAYLIVRDTGAAEDVAQDAFVRAFRQLHTFRRGEPFRPWLLRIVTNLALNEVRARSRRTGLLGRIGIFAERSVEPPHAAVAASDEASALLRAIGELAEDDRVVLHLRYYLELPEREIAAAVGKPAGTVKSRLHRASRRLRRVIESRYPELREGIDG
jgi:RNA polymerase sigma-70 factor (ECF subfamily)